MLADLQFVWGFVFGVLTCIATASVVIYFSFEKVTQHGAEFYEKLTEVDTKGGG